MARIVIISESESAREVTEILKAAGHEVGGAESLQGNGEGQLVLACARRWQQLEHDSASLHTGSVSQMGEMSDPLAAANDLAGKPLADIEKRVILSTLNRFKGHRQQTAEALGIGVRTLGMKIKRWREQGETIAGRQPRTPVHVNLS